MPNAPAINNLVLAKLVDDHKKMNEDCRAYLQDRISDLLPGGSVENVRMDLTLCDCVRLSFEIKYRDTPRTVDSVMWTREFLTDSYVPTTTLLEKRLRDAVYDKLNPGKRALRDAERIAVLHIKT